MCLIIFSWQPESQRPLILAANRDELHSRASLDAHDWTDPPGIFGGRDLEKKGSWLALSKPEGKNNYRLACLTNFRKPDQNAYPLSRGEIVRNFLISSESAFNYAQQIPFQHHAGFNALFMDGKDLVYCHHSSDNKPFIERLKSGVYGLSNAKLDTPWPKLVKSKQAFTNLNPYDSSETIANHLLSCLTDKEIAEDDTLPETGVGILIERMLSAVFIVSPNYGTRTSTAVIIDKSPTQEWIYFEERQFNPQGIQSRKFSKTLD